MSDVTAEAPEGREFVGYKDAAAYLGIARSTLSAYMVGGYGPRHRGRRTVGQYVQYVFRESDLIEWQARRPGRGFRSDLVHLGSDSAGFCNPCGGKCTVRLT